MKRTADENHVLRWVAADNGGGGRHYRAGLARGSGRDGAGGAAQHVGFALVQTRPGRDRRGLDGKRAPAASGQAGKPRRENLSGIGIKSWVVHTTAVAISSPGARRRNGGRRQALSQGR